MTAGGEPTPPHVTVRRSSVWALTAGTVLFVLGTLYVLYAASKFPEIRPSDSGIDLSGVAKDAAILVVVFGIVHLITAIFIWRHRRWARYLGLVFAVLGTFIGGVLVFLQGTAIGDLSRSPLLFLVSYAVAFVGLIVGKRHFKQG